MTTLLFILIGTVPMAWGLYCLRREVVWIKTPRPRHRTEAGEAWYLGGNAFLVFVSLFPMAVVNGISFFPVGSYLRWVFAVQGEPILFFIRLVPAYLVTVAVLAFFRPTRSLVSFDSVRITCTSRDGKAETVCWSELQSVAILTTDEGPFSDGIFWILSGGESDCLVRSKAEGMKKLLPRLQQLPGFNHEAVMQGMRSKSNESILCWQRKNGP